MNHRMQIWPNSRDTRAVPRLWIRNSPTRIAIVTAMIRLSLNTASPPGSVRSPSTAESTESEGVMIASP